MARPVGEFLLAASLDDGGREDVGARTVAETAPAGQPVGDVADARQPPSARSVRRRPRPTFFHEKKTNNQNQEIHIFVQVFSRTTYFTTDFNESRPTKETRLRGADLEVGGVWGVDGVTLAGGGLVALSSSTAETRCCFDSADRPPCCSSFRLKSNMGVRFVSAVRRNKRTTDAQQQQKNRLDQTRSGCGSEN